VTYPSPDMIVVGAGPAGATAALVGARAGLHVILLERGDHPGSKNMFGGVLHTHSLNEVVPRFYEEAPVERAITRRVINLVTEDASLALDYGHRKLAQAPYNAFSIIRGQFDNWLAGKARDAGALLLCRTVAQELLRGPHGEIAGVLLKDGSELRAPLTICADGVNSLLAERADLRPPFQLQHLALGVKQTLALPPQVIEDRCGLQPGEGIDMIYIGSFTRGMTGGAFVYTNYRTLSVGVTLGLADLTRSCLRPEEVLELFLEEPRVAELVDGAAPREYSAHLIPEGGIGMVPTISAAGVMLAGDAAGFVLNSGLNLEGANLAITSGRLAAETAVQAYLDGDLGAESLGRYRTALEASHVLADLKTFRGAHGFLANSRIYSVYPEMVSSLVEEIITVDGAPKRRLHRMALDHVGRQAGWKDVLRDAAASRRYI
jgi:electron transfer flavoprotein-quinone oxidoreductase